MSNFSPFGLPFLIVRRDTGSFASHRQLPTKFVPLAVGAIQLTWKHGPHRLIGASPIKIALGTADEAEMRTRWAQVHNQIEAIRIEAAGGGVHGTP